MQEQEKIVVTNSYGAQVIVPPDALPDYLGLRLTYLRALAGLLAGQDESYSAVTAECLDLNRTLVDEICSLFPYLVARQKA